MKNLFRLIVLLLILGGWAIAALSLHVVQGQNNRIVVIPKQSLSPRDIYVNVGNWTLADVAKHPGLVRRLIETGKSDLLQHVAPESTSETLIAELRSAVESGVQASAG